MATVFRHTSLTKGVSYHKPSKRWLGRFTLNGQKHYVGCFKEEADAAKAVNRARINVMNSYSLRNEMKDMLEQEKHEINTNTRWMSPVREWSSLTIRQIKVFANKNGIFHEDLIGDKRLKQTWVDALNARDVRPVTTKEPEIAEAIAEIDELIGYLDEDEEDDRDWTDMAVLDIPEEEWSPCVVVNPDEPSYYWCNAGFLYTLYPTEGYTVWRYDTTVSGNYKPIGVWAGDTPNDNEDEQCKSPWEVSVDREAGTYCMIDKSEDREEGEILENWAEGAVISAPLSDNRNHCFKLGKSAKMC